MMYVFLVVKKVLFLILVRQLSFLTVKLITCNPMVIIGRMDAQCLVLKCLVVLLINRFAVVNVLGLLIVLSMAIVAVFVSDSSLIAGASPARGSYVLALGAGAPKCLLFWGVGTLPTLFIRTMSGCFWRQCRLFFSPAFMRGRYVVPEGVS